MKPLDTDYHSSTSSNDSNNNDITTESVVIDVNNSENIELGNIQEEHSLITYTNNHFTHVSNNELRRIRNLENTTPDTPYSYIRCDSPITISNYGSRSGSSNNSSNNSDNDDDYNDNQLSPNNLNKNAFSTVLSSGNLQLAVQHTNKPRRHSKFKQLAYQDVEKTLDKYYDMELDNKYSSELDILSTFMKGQKNIYIQAKHLSQWRLNMLMIPSLLITCAITILSPTITCSDTHSWIISGLNAGIGFILSMMNYLKLESSTTMFLQLANHYDKMETALEMANSKIILMETEAEKRTLVLNQIQDIEQKMNEIKALNNVLLPAEIKSIFPIICHVNIFSFIKKLENHRRILILKFKDIKNEIRFILHKWDKEERKTNKLTNPNVNNRPKSRELNRLNFLCEIKEKLKVELTEYKCAYSNMDELFIHEIKRAETQTNKCGIWLLCLWKNNNNVKLKNINPLLDKYFHFLFTDD
tara:strand:- start:2324 stop:3736 length:1413 start_codon:yes stop_codon:yes gene_type:complete